MALRILLQEIWLRVYRRGWAQLHQPRIWISITVLGLAGLAAAHTEAGLATLQQLAWHTFWLPAAAAILAARRTWIRSRRLLARTQRHWLSVLPIPPQTQWWVLGIRNLGDFIVFALLGSAFLAFATIPDLYRLPLSGLLWAWLLGALATAAGTALALALSRPMKAPAGEPAAARHQRHEESSAAASPSRHLPSPSLQLIGVWQRRRIRAQGLQRRTRLLLLVIGLSLPMGTPFGIGAAVLLLGLALGRFIETVAAAATVLAEALPLLSLQPLPNHHLRYAGLWLPLRYACAYAILSAILLVLIGAPLISAILLALLFPAGMGGMLTVQARISGQQL